MRLQSWDAMKHDKRMATELGHDDPDDYNDRRFDVSLWLAYYWWPTRGWSARLGSWWHYKVRRYPKPPPLDLDPVYQRLFGNGGPS